MAIASALLAGVLARFGIQAFAAAQTALPLVLLMLAIYLLGKRLLPRYAVVLTLAGAIVLRPRAGELAWSEVAFHLRDAGVHHADVQLGRPSSAWRFRCSW